jgi:hypothetical protein
MSRLSLIARSVFLIGFVVAMPLLALPSVSRRLDELLYGKAKAVSATSSLEASDNGVEDDGDVAQATFVTPLEDSLRPRSGGDAKRGLDAGELKPPPLAATPSFPAAPTQAAPESTANPSGHTNKTSPKLDLSFSESSFQSASPQPIPGFDRTDQDETANQRLGKIRQQLEDLGADYIVLEVVEKTGQYHFLCRMLVSPQSRDTESFEASGKDAVALAEQVLKSVEAWRAAQASPPR